MVTVREDSDVGWSISSFIQFSAFGVFPHHVAILDDVGFGNLKGPVLGTDVRLGSRMVSKEHMNLIQEALYFCGFLSTLTADDHEPSITCAETALSEGISSTQGAHQVAQKFSTRTLPPNEWA